MRKNVICGLICVAIIVASVGFAGAEQKKKGTSGVTVRTEQVKIVVPDDVKEAWQSVDLNVTDKKSHSSQIVSVDIGKEAALPGSSLKVAIDVFLPAFKMEGATITTNGAEPSNPAAKIRIKDKGKVIYEGWFYEKWPTSHPFEHPQVAVSLAGYNRKEGKAEAIEDVPEITIKKVVYQKEEQVIPTDLIEAEPLYIFRTEEEFTSAAFSPGGRYFATGDKEGDIGVWEVGRWKKNAEWRGDRSSVTHITLSPNGQNIATRYRGSPAGGPETFILDVQSMKNKRIDRFRPISFSPNGEYLAGDGGSNEISILAAGDWSTLVNIKVELDETNDIVFSPDSSTMAVLRRVYCHFGMGKCRSLLSIFKVGSWSDPFTIEQDDLVNSLSYSPDNRYLATAGEDKIIRIYDAGSWKELHKIGLNNPVTYVSFSPDSRYLITDGKNQPVHVFDVRTWKPVYSIKNLGITAFNGRWLVDKDRNNNLVVLDVSPFTAYYLGVDLDRLYFKQKSEDLNSSLQIIDSDFKDGLKVLETEKNDALAKLGGTVKDEFEIEAAFKSRMAQREANIKEINGTFEGKRLELRRERTNKRIVLINRIEDEFNALLDATRKPVKFDISLKTYNADAELFPLSIMENGVAFYSAFVKVPKDKAKGFKENIAKYQVSGQTQLDRTGRIKIVNAAIKDAEGASYPISNPRLSGDVIFTGTY